MSLSGKPLIQLADIANCVSGDFHMMHLNFKGGEFDSFHKDTLKGYYEQAANDYDTWSEDALMFPDTEAVPNTNCSAERLEYKSYEGPCDREAVIVRTKEILAAYLEALTIVYVAMSKEDKDTLAIGIANAVQTRIEYWNKELLYFNSRRFGR